LSSFVAANNKFAKHILTCIDILHILRISDFTMND